jgi:AmiR/NasT family two-component response regulator
MAPGTSFDLRSLKVVVAHPRDPDGEVLIRSLQRLGGQVEHVWPAPERQGERADLVFYLLGQQNRDLLSLRFEAAHTTLIVIVDPSEALSAQGFANSNPHAALVKPFDTAAILTSILVARNNSGYQRRLLHKISKLEETLRSARTVERAKAILMQKRRIGESAAYSFLRDQAMKKRIPIGAIAAVIVESDEVLSGDTG